LARARSSGTLDAPSAGGWRERGEILSGGDEGRVIGLDAWSEDRDGAPVMGGGLGREVALGEQHAEVVQHRG